MIKQQLIKSSRKIQTLNLRRLVANRTLFSSPKKVEDTLTQLISTKEKEALLLMFGHLWQKKYWSLDGEKGRPSLSECIDFALRRKNTRIDEDLVDFLENYLQDMARRCQASAQKDQKNLSV